MKNILQRSRRKDNDKENKIKPLSGKEDCKESMRWVKVKLSLTVINLFKHYSDFHLCQR